MPNNRKPLRRSAPAKKRPSPTLQVQKQILASSKAQEIRPEFTVPDVPRMRIKRLKVHTVQLKVTTAMSVQFGVFTWTASTIPDIASFSQVFDQFRIAQVALDFYPLPSFATIFATSLDYTDAVTPASYVSVLDSESSYAPTPGVYSNRVFSPRYQLAQSGSGDPATISSAFIPIQTGSSTSPVLNQTVWGAVKWATPAPPTGNFADVIVTLVVSFRATD